MIFVVWGADLWFSAPERPACIVLSEVPRPCETGDPALKVPISFAAVHAAIAGAEIVPRQREVTDIQPTVAENNVIEAALLSRVECGILYCAALAEVTRCIRDPGQRRRRHAGASHNKPSVPEYGIIVKDPYAGVRIGIE